jgi:hypothetical protein
MSVKLVVWFAVGVPVWPMVWAGFMSKKTKALWAVPMAEEPRLP